MGGSYNFRVVKLFSIPYNNYFYIWLSIQNNILIMRRLLVVTIKNEYMGDQVKFIALQEIYNKT